MKRKDNHIKIIIDRQRNNRDMWTVIDKNKHKVEGGLADRLSHKHKR